MYSIYEVLNKETLNDIAKKLNISIDELIELNGQLGDIMPGQLLIVPKQDNFYQTYIVKKGDNLYSIAQKYNTDTKTLELLNGLDGDDYIYPNQRLLIPKENIPQKKNRLQQYSILLFMPQKFCVEFIQHIKSFLLMNCAVKRKI